MIEIETELHFQFSCEWCMKWDQALRPQMFWCDVITKLRWTRHDTSHTYICATAPVLKWAYSLGVDQLGGHGPNRGKKFVPSISKKIDRRRSGKKICLRKSRSPRWLMVDPLLHVDSFDWVGGLVLYSQLHVEVSFQSDYNRVYKKCHVRHTGEPFNKFHIFLAFVDILS